MRRLLVGSLLAIAITVVAILGMRSQGSDVAQAGHGPGGSITKLDIDVDPTDTLVAPNTAPNEVCGTALDSPILGLACATTAAGAPDPDQEVTSLGTIDKCVVSAGNAASVPVDVVVSGWPDGLHRLIGYDVALKWTPNGVGGASIPAGGTNLGVAPGFLPRSLLSADPQSGAFGSYGVGEDLLPDTTGAHKMGVIDTAGPDGDAAANGGNANLVIDGVEENKDGEETADGFIVRATIDTPAAGSGFVVLTLGPGLSGPTKLILADAVQGSLVPVANFAGDGTGPTTDPGPSLIAYGGAVCPVPTDLKIVSQVLKYYDPTANEDGTAGPGGNCSNGFDDGKITPPGPAFDGDGIDDVLDNDAAPTGDFPGVGDTDVVNDGADAADPDCTTSGPATVDTSEDMPVQVIKTIHNNGNPPPGQTSNVNLVKTVIPPNDCDVTYTPQAGEVITVNGVPASPPPPVGVPFTVAAPYFLDVHKVIPNVQVSVVVPDETENFTFHCAQPSFHQWTIINDISNADPLVPDPNTVNNTATTTFDATVIGQADLDITAFTTSGIDTDGDTDVDIPTGFLPAVLSDDGVDNDNDCVGAHPAPATAPDRDPGPCATSGGIDEDPVGDCDSNDSWPLDYIPNGNLDDDNDGTDDEDGPGQCLLVVVNKTIHNAGPYGPVSGEATSATGAVIADPTIPFGPAAGVPANCSLTPFFTTPISFGPLAVSASTVVTEKYTLHCGISPFFEVDDDTDLDYDEDPINGADTDKDGMEDGSGPVVGSAGDCDDGVDNGDGDSPLYDQTDPECQPFIDEDPYFEILCTDFDNTIAVTGTHINDPDSSNDSATDSSLCGIPALLNFDPEAHAYIDENSIPSAPNNPATLAATDDNCLTTLACEQQLGFKIPAGQPLAGVVSKVPAAGGASDGFTITNGFSGFDFNPATAGDNTPNGTFVLQADAVATLDQITPGVCNTVVTPSVQMEDGAIRDISPAGPANAPGLFGGAIPFASLDEGPNFPNGGIGAGSTGGGGAGVINVSADLSAFNPNKLVGIFVVADNDGDTVPETVDTIVANTATSITVMNIPLVDPAGAITTPLPAGRLMLIGLGTELFSPNVWPVSLESHGVVSQYLANGVPVFARYTGYNIVPLNAVVFFTGTSYDHVLILADPGGPPSGILQCAEFSAELIFAGETSPGAIDLRRCDDVGTHTFDTDFTRVDIGTTTTVQDDSACAEINVSVDLEKDEFPGNGTPGPAGELNPDVIDVGLTSDPLRVKVTTTGPSDVDLSLALSGPTACNPQWLNQTASPSGGAIGTGPAPDVGPSNAVINGTALSTMGFTDVGAGSFDVFYTVNCSPAGDYPLQIIANVDSQIVPVATSDPNPDDNQAQNHPVVTATADSDDDGVDTPTDNCPSIPNPLQEDADNLINTDNDGNVCDDDDDDDTILDTADQCSPGDDTAAGAGTGPDLDDVSAANLANLWQEDFGDQEEADGCPDTDLLVEKSDDTAYDVDVSVSESKTVDITVTNGDTPADVLVHVLAVSDLDACEAKLQPKAGYTLTQFTTDEDGDTVDDTLWSQLEWTVSLSAGQVYATTRDYDIHCYQRSQRIIEIQVDAVPLPPVEEENVENLTNVAKNYPVITAWDNADLKKQSVSIIGAVASPGQCAGGPILPAPTSIDVSENVNLCIAQTVHNNGPALTEAQDVLTATAPTGCTVDNPNDGNPAGPTATSTAGIEPPVSSAFTFYRVITIHCTQSSFHEFDFDNVISVDQIHTKDDYPDNDTASTSLGVMVLAEADLEVTGVNVTGLPAGAPPEIDVSTDVPITITANVKNNGPANLSNVTVNIAANVTPSGDCTLTPSSVNAGPMSIASGATVPINLNTTLHCTKPSSHSINVTADATLSDPHISDPDTGNNDGTAAAAFNSIAQADLKITSAVTQDDLPTAGTQILIGPLNPTGSGSIQLSETIHNNGPFGPVNAQITRSTANPSDCNAVATSPASVTNLQVSGVSQTASSTVNLNWLDIKKPPYSCNATITQSIAVTTQHVVDPTSSNNSDTIAVTLVRDTDDDTVPDNFDGVRDNCQDVPNLNQTDTDQDGLGNACDDNPDHETSITCDVLLGPAAVNLSDTNGRYGWLVCDVFNNDPDDVRVTISVTLSNPPAGCSQVDVMILPGQASFVLLAGEHKAVVERVRIECHASGQTPPGTATPQVYDLSIEKCISMEGLDLDNDDDGDIDEDPINGADDDGDSLIDEDPPEGTEDDLSNNCDSIGKPVVIELP